MPETTLDMRETPDVILRTARRCGVDILTIGQGNAGNPDFRGHGLLDREVELNANDAPNQPEEDPTKDDGTTIHRGRE